MPKELMHWHIAHGALNRELPAAVKEIILEHSQMYYLGAIAHDIPFYDLAHSAGRGIEQIGDELHGVNGEDTLAPLVLLLENCPAESPALVSFVLGMLTHYIADSTFHPLVYYLSGNYFAVEPEARALAVFRHRLLETALDLWVQREDPLQHPTSVARLWRKTGASGRQALALLTAQYAGADGDRAACFQSAWRYHRLLQTLFQWWAPWKILSVYRASRNPGAQKYEALFYHQPLDLSLLDEEFSWQHPVSGQEKLTTFAAHYHESITLVSELFGYLGRSRIEAWPALLRQLEPLSLDSGLPYVPVQDMKYFWSERIELRLRTK